MSRLVDTFAVVLIASGLWGCGQSSPNDNPATTNSPPAANVSEIVRRDASALPIGDFLLPLDDGRVEIAAPKDWQTIPRGSDHVVNFYLNDRNGLPRIDVTVGEQSVKVNGELSEANLAEFVKQIGSEVESQDIDLLEPVIPMVIGPHPCARYVSQLKMKVGNSIVHAERQTIVLSHAGRLYTITLLTSPSDFKSGRDAAYAVCASFKFLDMPFATPPAAAEAPAAETTTGTP